MNQLIGDLDFLNLIGTHRGDQIDPDVQAYQSATGISTAAATVISNMLTEARLNNIEPAFMWVGGYDYNQANQARAVIGGTGTVVGAKAGVPVAEGANYCRFNRSKFLKFTNPVSTRSAAISSLVVMVWYEVLDAANWHNIVNMYGGTSARGPIVVNDIQSGLSRRRVTTFVSAGGAANPDIRCNPGSANDALRGTRIVVSHLKPNSGTASLLDAHNVTHASGAIYNDASSLYIGGIDEASTLDVNLSNARVHAVIIAPTMTESLAARVRGGSIPFTAGMLSPSIRPELITVGDSTTAAKWNSFLVGSVNGGPWNLETALHDLSLGGQSLDYFVSITQNIIDMLNTQAWENRYFYYAMETLLAPAASALGIPATVDAWCTRTQQWLEQIQAATNCRVILGSYIKGNNSAGATAEQLACNAFAQSLAASKGWDFVPFYDDPHSQVWTGSVPGTYGFYVDDIHQADPGKIIGAEVFAACVAHPSNTSAPRAVYGAGPVITGTLTSGSLLTCSTGSWTNTPTSYTYQWLRNLTPISGATSSTYTLQAGDVGTRIACRVTAVKTGQNSATFTSAPTAAIT